VLKPKLFSPIFNFYGYEVTIETSKTQWNNVFKK